MRCAHIALVIVAVALALPVVAQSTKSDMEILRQKIKADKKLVVAANMELTEDEAKVFWPVYDAYQKDLHKINGRLVAAIKAYADAYEKGPISDKTAMKLITEAIDIEDAEVKLKRSYVTKLDKVIPGMKIARYIQIENKIRAVIKFDLAAKIPLVK